MFTSRIFQRVSTRVPKRGLGQAAAVRDGVFREKSFKQTWLMDKGAYPVMSVSVLGIIACSSFGAYYMATSPDCKLATGGSRSKMFRLDIANDYIKEDVDVCKK